MSHDSTSVLRILSLPSSRILPGQLSNFQITSPLCILIFTRNIDSCYGDTFWIFLALVAFEAFLALETLLRYCIMVSLAVIVTIVRVISCVPILVSLKDVVIKLVFIVAGGATLIAAWCFWLSWYFLVVIIEIFAAGKVQLRFEATSAFEALQAFDTFEIVDVALVIFLNINGSYQGWINYVLIIKVWFLPTAFFRSK